MPYKPDFIFRGNNTAIILLQNSEKHCIGWFLTAVLINLKHRETCKLSFESSGKQDFPGLKVFRIFQWEVQQILPIISDFGIIRKFIRILLSMVQLGLSRLKMVHIKASHMSTI